MGLLHHRWERALPGEVEADAVRVAVADEADAMQRLEHLDGVSADARVERALVECVGESDAVLMIAQSDACVGVDDAERGVDTEAGDEEQVAGAVVGVEVAPVVEVAVGRRRVLDRQRRLVDRVLVEW